MQASTNGALTYEIPHCYLDVCSNAGWISTHKSYNAPIMNQFISSGTPSALFSWECHLCIDLSQQAASVTSLQSQSALQSIYSTNHFPEAQLFTLS
ncbi:hypothetical protein TNCT_177161 [Trichonephila clavata]|uniref:Uncharacterized protein n=1 Tax=Trichonephila clavata TaxID=2740835 RepID=A0A8X6KF88_TRICU|nr:hypothetical protein TNCT_177161 [Trichonephila clavata]